MDFLGDFSIKGSIDAVLKDGGPGVTGLVGAGFVGRKVENYVMGATPVTAASSNTDKAKAWAANNIPKLILYSLLRRSSGPTMEGVRKGTVESVFFDSVMRLLNSGVNPATATIMGFQVLGSSGVMSAGQANEMAALVQKNQQLQNEINAMGQRMASMQWSYPPGSMARQTFFNFMDPAQQQSMYGVPGIPKGTQYSQYQVPTPYAYAGGGVQVREVANPQGLYTAPAPGTVPVIPSPTSPAVAGMQYPPPAVAERLRAFSFVGGDVGGFNEGVTTALGSQYEMF